MKFFRSCIRVYNTFEEWFIMTAIAVMGTVLALQVFSRYVLNQPLVWSEELARYIFVWITFIGASYGVHNNIHISMELLFKRLPRLGRLAVNTFTNLFAAAVFIALVPAGMEFVEDQHFIESSAMGIPMSYVFIAVPFGCALVAVRLLCQTAFNLGTKGAEL